jgi:hypothetical protein
MQLNLALQLQLSSCMAAGGLAPSFMQEQQSALVE